MIWPSDDSNDVERIDIMSGAMPAYPLAVFSNHVSACPNDQVKGSRLKNNGLLLPYRLNGANADTTGLIGDFQSARISLEELN